MKSRTEYSAKNTTVSVICRILAIIMGYVLRIVFTHQLSSTYVGINGLFVDIIQVLSLSEMGVGTAITFALYQPVADGDIEKQKSLMRLFRHFYIGIAGAVACFGMILIPFLGTLIKDYGSMQYVVPIFLLYVTNAVCSYLWIYKKMLMDAHQLIYIGVSYQTISWFIQDFLQILILIFTGNFILYLVVQIVVTIACNLLISYKAEKLYPFLKEKETKPLNKEDRKGVFQNIKAMMMHKLGEVVINNTDNLLISAFVGIVQVGKYSNYFLVIESLNQILTQVFQGIAASVGNLGVTQDEKRVRKVFETTLFIGQWMCSVITIGIYEVINPFIAISFGKEYCFAMPIVFLLSLRFYLLGIRKAAQVFHDSLGLFYFDRYKSIAEAVLNIVISLLLVQKYGVMGVFAGTVVSMLFVSIWVEPYVLYHYRLHLPVRTYYQKMIPYAAITAIVWRITHILCDMASKSGNGTIAVTFVVRFLICILVPDLLFLLCYHRCKAFQVAIQKVKMLLEQKRQQKYQDEMKRR